MVVALHHRPQAHRHPLRDLDHDLLLHRRLGGDADPAGASDAGRRPRLRRHLQQALHPARDHHDLVLPRAGDPDHARQLPDSADDRRARRGLSAAQPLLLVSEHQRRDAGARRHPLRRRRHRLDVLHAVLELLLQQLRGARRARRLRRRLLVDRRRPQLHRHHPYAADARHVLVPPAALRLGQLRDQPDHGAGDAGAGDHAAPDRGGALVRARHLRSDARRRPAALPASLLVLLAPRRLHHDPAGDGRGQRDHRLLRAPPRLRLPGDGLRDPRRSP